MIKMTPDQDTLAAIMDEMRRFAAERGDALRARPATNSRQAMRNRKLGHQLGEVIGLTLWLEKCQEAGEIIPIGHGPRLGPVKGRGGGRR